MPRTLTTLPGDLYAVLGPLELDDPPLLIASEQPVVLAGGEVSSGILVEPWHPRSPYCKGWPDDARILWPSSAAALTALLRRRGIGTPTDLRPEHVLVAAARLAGHDPGWEVTEEDTVMESEVGAGVGWD